MKNFHISLEVRPFVLCSALLLLASVVPAFGGSFTITPTFDSSITSDPNAAAIKGVIDSAINFYENTFINSINVTIDFKEMNTGLGQSITGLYGASYSSYYSALVASATSPDDFTALAHLPGGTNNPVTGGANIAASSANVRALGFNIPGGVNGFDGVIGLNTNFTDIGSPGTTGEYSLFATTEHEIDEVLGLGSDVSQTGFFANPRPEDLFRYDASGNRTYKTTGNAFFSINGTTDLAQFNNQKNGGDWGDWQSWPLPPGVLPQVQDAFAIPGTHPFLTVTSPEVQALDVIGYTLAPQVTAVPEPASIALLTSGLLGIVVLRRRVRSK